MLITQNSYFGNQYTRLYARKKSSGKWDILFNDEDEDFYCHIGNTYKELYIYEDYIEFGFEFDVSDGITWPYSSVFWTAADSANEKAENIVISITGNKVDCSYGSQYDWSK